MSRLSIEEKFYKMKMLLTFDHELPLGAVKSYQKGIFEPSDKLINLAYEVGAPINLFSDICCAIRYKEWDIDFYNQYKTQLHFAIDKGNDVQLHIHPHWLTSKYINGTFIPSLDYSLSQFAKNQIFPIEVIIDLAFNALNEICKEKKTDYKCIAFRAGGYNVEPESKRILNKLYNLGIRYDSSVVKGLYQNYSFSKVDYRKTPDMPNWSISKHGPLTKQVDSDMFELPITSMPISIGYSLSRRINKFWNKKAIISRSYNNTGKGYSMTREKNSIFDLLRSAVNPVFLSLDNNHVTVDSLEQIVKYNLKKYQGDPDELIMTLISHPKSMGDYHLNLMKSFIDRLRAKHKNNISFITYTDLAKPK